MHVLRASRFSQRASAFSRRNAVLLALLALLAISLSLRLYGLNWDGGALYHPDERAILWQGTEFSGKRGVSEIHKPANLSEFFSVESPLNPHWFPYGSLSIYLLKGLSWVLSPMLGPYSLHDYAVLGRALNAIVDSATMLLVFLLAARLFGRRVGLLAAAFTTFAALHIQLSHFYASDVLLTFFAVLTMLFLSRVAARGDPLSALLAGVALGLGVATKVSFAPMLAAVFVAYALYAFFADETAKGVTFNAQRLQVALAGLLMTVGAAGIAFVVTQPYAVIDWRAFARDVNEQSEMVRRIRDYPYTRQYIDTPAYLYPAVQFAKWSVGPLLGVLAWLGFAFGLVAAAAYRRRADILLLSWVVPYFLITGWFDVKFLRYMLPIAPFLAIFAARLLVAAYDWLKAGHRPRLNPRWALAVTGVVLLATAFYGVAYTRIYSRPHPAQAMARWIDQNVPPGARIAREHWDECVVGRFWSCDPNAPNGMLIVESYNDDTPFKQNQLISQLQQADYTVHFSNRLYGTIPRLPERYPMTTAFYQRLMDGSLGFELLRAETSYPGLFGVSFVDDTFTRPGLATPAGFDRFRPGGLTFNLGFADESFSVYDHPTVLLFKKVRQLSPEELRKLLPLGQQSAGPLPLTYAAEGAREQQQGGTWSKIFDPDGLFNKVPELTWLVMVQLIFLLTLPLGLVLFRALPDRGYLLIKALGILLAAFVPWVLASLHWMPFSRGSILLGLLLIALASGLCLWRWRTELWDFLRQRWKLVLAAEVLFLVAFFSFYALRLANPDLWHPYRGGEKPMDFAYLNAVTRSTWMPPYDPWFAGGYLNYYYFGQFIVGTLIKLSGVVPSVAYNLAVPLLFSLLVGAVFSVGYNLAAGLRKPASGQGGLGRWLLSPWVAGLLAVVFVTVLGNFDGAVQLGQSTWHWLKGEGFTAFDYWRSSRLLTPDPPGFEINEFPFFTFLFADLHAHLIALPFTVLALGLGLALVQGAARGLRLVHSAAVYVALALTLGALRITNSWDAPTYLLLAVGALALAVYFHRKRLDAPFLAWTVGLGLALYGLTTLLFLGFHRNYINFYTGIARNNVTTSLHQYLEIHGVFVFIVASFLLFLLWQRSKAPTLQVSGGAIDTAQPKVPVARAVRQQAWRIGGLAVTAAAVGVMAALGYATVAGLLLLLAMVMAVAAFDIARAADGLPARLFLYGMLALALVLGIGVDFIKVQGDIDRMNTVFKFYLQAWVLMGLAAGVGAWWLLSYVDLVRGTGIARVGRGLWLGFLVLLVAASAVYPVMGARARIGDRFGPSLGPGRDGMAYMARARYRDLDLRYDLEGIRWLQRNVQGSPVVLEAVPSGDEAYQWFSRIAVYTGLPSIMGWEWHQMQQRAASRRGATPEEARLRDAIFQRQRDAAQLYSTVDSQEALRLLRQYKVGYVYVGPMERQRYAQAGLVKFDHMVGQGLELAYQYPSENPQVKIYRVLAAATGYTKPPVCLSARPGDVYRIWLDCSLAKRELGWQAATPLEEGLRRTVEAIRGKAGSA